MSPTSVPLRGYLEGDDLAVAPFVGVSAEIMTPAFAIPTRPRLFLNAEILPTFASDRRLAIEGDPDCVRGTEQGSPCASTLQDTVRDRTFTEDDATGVGTSTTATVDTLVFGANLGVAFPARIGKRRLRIKPSIAWINYKVKADGLVVFAQCAPPTRCTPSILFGFPAPGVLRSPERVESSDSQRFNGIGAGLDIEMDAARWGPLGASIFVGGSAYYTLGDRTMSFGASQSYDDEIGNDVVVTRHEVTVDSWMYRAHVGFRVRWLGSAK